MAILVILISGDLASGLQSIFPHHGVLCFHVVDWGVFGNGLTGRDDGKVKSKREEDDLPPSASIYDFSRSPYTKDAPRCTALPALPARPLAIPPLISLLNVPVTNLYV